MKRLIVVHNRHHGLGNRVRAALSARSLATAEGRRFGYRWPVGKEFGARFDDLWNFRQPEVSRWYSLRSAPKRNRRDPALSWLSEESRKERLWLFRTPHELALPANAQPWPELLRALRPEASIAEMINDFHTEHLAEGRYVGVMIRASRLSHRATLQHSPVSWFVAQMEAERARHPDAAFFISCDTAEVQEDLQRRFDRCYFLTDKGPYNSAAALRSSVTDLYLLASSSLILAPHHSSFPELAHHLCDESVPLRTSLNAGAAESETTVAKDPTRPHLRTRIN